MAYKLLVTHEAERDIDNIVQYIAGELKNRTAAIGFLNDVEEAYLSVVQQPHMYSYCNDNRLREKEYRKIHLRNYIMVYRVSDNEESIIVLRVFYGRMDYLKLL